MKLMTLNCHSLEEPDYEEKLSLFCTAVFREQPHIVALQEVNQTQTAPLAEPSTLSRSGYCSCMNGSPDLEAPIPVRADNHALRAAQLLTHLGYPCSWTWVPAKTGYDRYDEGLALFSRFPILDTWQFPITDTRDYHNWRTRKALGIRAATPSGPQNFFSLHMGWWQDGEEPFARQWECLTSRLATLPPEPVWLMGDFNSPARVSGEGYTLISSQGWTDTYHAAANRDSGITVAHTIDGWQDEGETGGMRIDYIFTDSPAAIQSSRVIFNGSFHPVVSDHFGVMVETMDESMIEYKTDPV